MKRQITFLTTCIVVISMMMMMTILTRYSFDFILFLDTIFVCSLLLTMAGASMFIVQTGVYRPYLQHVRYFFRHFNRSKQIANEIERVDNHPLMPPPHLPLTVPFTLTGITLSVLTTFISFLVQ